MSTPDGWDDSVCLCRLGLENHCWGSSNCRLVVWWFVENVLRVWGGVSKIVPGSFLAFFVIYITEFVISMPHGSVNDLHRDFEEHCVKVFSSIVFNWLENVVFTAVQHFLTVDSDK